MANNKETKSLKRTHTNLCCKYIYLKLIMLHCTDYAVLYIYTIGLFQATLSPINIIYVQYMSGWHILFVNGTVREEFDLKF